MYAAINGQAHRRATTTTNPTATNNNNNDDGGDGDDISSSAEDNSNNNDRGNNNDTYDDNYDNNNTDDGGDNNSEIHHRSYMYVRLPDAMCARAAIAPPSGGAPRHVNKLCQVFFRIFSDTIPAEIWTLFLCLSEYLSTSDISLQSFFWRFRVSLVHFL